MKILWEANGKLEQAPSGRTWLVCLAIDPDEILPILSQVKVGKDGQRVRVLVVEDEGREQDNREAILEDLWMKRVFSRLRSGDRRAEKPQSAQKGEGDEPT